MKFSLVSTRLLVALTLMFFAFSCSEDDPATPAGEGNGDFSVEMTDAPIDDAQVKAVFVTVSDIRVDGQSVEGFNSTTVEISALTNGNTETLYDGQLAADSYSKLEIVLEDGANAVNGGPGCYVLNQDNEKIALEVANDGVLTVQNSDFTLSESGSVAAVVDFDLRKALVRTDNEAKPYRFAAESRLENSLRFVTKDRSGTITGTINDESNQNGEIVVYAYAKGTYSDSEAQGSSDDELFLNAVSSTTVNGNMEYTLAFLEEGQYELVAASYKDTDNDGEVEMRGTFELSTLTNLDLAGIAVTGNSTTTADFTIKLIF
ncbi:hypothetical protein GGR26_000852 [Lewinella marina]|uniref:DUF4382 domain-containing protein n=1 Tax=Neolewinella marina TaxID=438751 RepID=A0A2G0CIF8_9BACT|nr:DUF4382 domain-containing protein [Neolewinella marina]NJB85107.1 hypothetical protein [Neolewinella marina]PHK99756.1 hypothetical protein CGL56_01520 [Neolewinella marina]